MLGRSRSTSSVGVLGTAQFPTTKVGYRSALAWLAEFGQVVAVGVEGTPVVGCGWRPSRWAASSSVGVAAITRALDCQAILTE